MNLDQMADEMHRLSELLDDALSYLKKITREAAVAEDAYRLARAHAYLQSDGTVDERRSLTDQATSNQRQQAHITDGLRQAALEAVRSRRAQISALQSLLAAHRAEAEFVRTGPQL